MSESVHPRVALYEPDETPAAQAFAPPGDNKPSTNAPPPEP